jgi:hypothetical protein
MRDWFMVGAAAAIAACIVSIGGCGLFYQAGSRIKTSHMKAQLKVGESAIQVHQDWGEPDLRKNVGEHSELWSYASHPNNNDIAASVFYTSTKSGDEGKFLDLKFIDGKLVSWSESERTMPAKQGAGFSYGFGPGGAVSPVQHY